MTEKNTKGRDPNVKKPGGIGLSRDPDSSLALARKLTRNDLRMQKKEEEIEALERDLEKIPEDADILFRLGKLYTEVGRTEDAKKKLELAVKLIDSNFQIFKTLAGNYKKQGDKEMAVAAYRVFLAYDALAQNLALRGEATESQSEEQMREAHLHEAVHPRTMQ